MKDLKLENLKLEDLKVWNELFKDINNCGEKDFLNFVQEFNFLLNSKDRHLIMMFIIKKLK